MTIEMVKKLLDNALYISEYHTDKLEALFKSSVLIKQARDMLDQPTNKSEVAE